MSNDRLPESKNGTKKATRKFPSLGKISRVNLKYLPLNSKMKSSRSPFYIKKYPIS